jgi:hypothetical protein
VSGERIALARSVCGVPFLGPDWGRGWVCRPGRAARPLHGYEHDLGPGGQLEARPRRKTGDALRNVQGVCRPPGPERPWCLLLAARRHEAALGITGPGLLRWRSRVEAEDQLSHRRRHRALLARSRCPGFLLLRAHGLFAPVAHVLLIGAAGRAREASPPCRCLAEERRDAAWQRRSQSPSKLAAARRLRASAGAVAPSYIASSRSRKTATTPV